jgi:2-dehydro-3-deoxygluconokinase
MWMADFISAVCKGKTMKKVITFGEIMVRLSPPGVLRFSQARIFEVEYGGGEANVAAMVSQLGLPTEFVTRLPENDLGDACLQFLHQHNIGCQYIQRGGARLGIYFLENGSSLRGSKVVYDRAGSSFATLKTGMIDWKAVFSEAGWFHWTGITPAVSESAYAVCLEALKTAKELGLMISVDMNYRAKLWKWGRTAGDVMSELIQYCDLAIGNEEDAEKVFGISAPGSDTINGKVEAEGYQFVCEQLAGRFLHLKKIAITLRGSLSASHNTWSGLLWEDGKLCAAPVYQITPIVDRVGSGDSFAGGLIYGLQVFTGDSQRALEFAVAASALKHTIFGDFNCVTRDEIEKLMKGDGSGRVSR